MERGTSFRDKLPEENPSTMFRDILIRDTSQHHHTGSVPNTIKLVLFQISATIVWDPPTVFCSALFYLCCDSLGTKTQSLLIVDRFGLARKLV
jgi:hypothetical protein